MFRECLGMINLDGFLGFNLSDEGVDPDSNRLNSGEN